MKARLRTHGGVANPRHSYGYVCGLRHALGCYRLALVLGAVGFKIGLVARAESFADVVARITRDQHAFHAQYPLRASAGY